MPGPRPRRRGRGDGATAGDRQRPGRAPERQGGHRHLQLLPAAGRPHRQARLRGGVDAPASTPLPDCGTETRPRHRPRSVVARSVSATGEGTSDCVVIFSHVSSRIGSEFGTLGERLAAMKPKPAERPVVPARHVWVQTPSGRQAGLLVDWVTGVDGTWWGRVAVLDAPARPASNSWPAGSSSPRPAGSRGTRGSGQASPGELLLQPRASAVGLPQGGGPARRCRRPSRCRG